jgi:capsular exopolysaccharide synthesis family protein
MNNTSQSLTRPRKQAEKIGLQASPSSATDENALDLGAVWETVKRSKWIILGTCVLVTILTAAITMMMPQVYEASAVVSIERPQAAAPMMMGLNDQRDLSSEIGILQNSGELARRVVETVETAADTTRGVQFTLLAPVSENEPYNQYAAMLRLRDMVSFAPNSQQQLILIQVESQDPTEAALIANAFAQQYRLFSREMARAGVVAAREFLESQLDKRKDDIRVVENEWEMFARSNAVVTEGLDGKNVAEEYAELQSQRDALTFQLEQEKRTLTVLEDQLEKVQPGLRSSVLKEQEVQSLRTQIQALENQIADLKATAEQYYINDPTLRGNESRVRELADIKRRIDGFEARKVELTEELVEASRKAGGMGTGGMGGEGTVGQGQIASIGQLGTLQGRIQEQRLKIEQIEAQIQALENRISGYQGRLESIPRQTIQREQLERRLAQAEQFYKEIAMELQRTIVTEESELGYVKIMRSAVVPMFPVSPNVKQNLVLGILLGLGLGMGLGFLRQSMNSQIYEPDDIQTKGYSLVGVIPMMDREIKKTFQGDELVDVEGRKISTRLFPLLNPWSPITENYRLVRANLQFASMKNGQQNGHASSQIMMVTSPEPGDGKTTTAVNLAITIALSGRKVLLIDADMRRPNSHKMLGVERRPGLAQILSGENGLTHTIFDDPIIDGFDVLPAGVPNVPPTELLDSERMRTLIAAVTELYDVVVIDTPPVLAATDPVVVAPYCDAILVVASADKTDFRALSQVKSTLEAVGVAIGGIIFNRYDAERASSSYKYGYGYGYKYDYAPVE